MDENKIKQQDSQYVQHVHKQNATIAEEQMIVIQSINDNEIHDQ